VVKNVKSLLSYHSVFWSNSFSFIAFSMLFNMHPCAAENFARKNLCSGKLLCKQRNWSHSTCENFERFTEHCLGSRFIRPRT